MTDLAQQIQAPNVCLMGEMGSGKTHSIRTLVSHGIEVFYIATEPGFQEMLGDIPSDKLHWHYVESHHGSIGDLRNMAELLNKNALDNVQKMGGTNKQNHQQFYELVGACNDFICQRTGQSFGDPSTWDHTRALVVDSLTGVNNMAIRLITGDKPFTNFPEMLAAQGLLEQFVNTCCTSTKCWFIMTAHLERETDPATGRSELMVSSLGKALAPKIPRLFSDVIHCKGKVENGKVVRTWNTMSNEARVKTRNLPEAENLAPDFGPLIASWKKKVGIP